MNAKKVLAAVLLAGSTLGAVGCASDGHDRAGREVISDSTITAKVKTALLAEKDVNSYDINVETYNRIVQLSGFVDSKWQIEKAEKVAANINGVKGVKNDLIHKSN
jgi:hyperosmotically inducible periplasmic protein